MDQLGNISYLEGAGMIVVMCFLVLCIGLFRRRLDLLFGFVLRFFCGLVGIYLINMIVAKAASDMTVGMNPVTLLTGTILGIPGLALLYGIKFVSTL